MPYYSVKNPAHQRLILMIFLDGEELRGVLEADTEAGWVVVCRRNNDGSIMRDGEKILTERLEGKVVVVDLETVG